MGALEGGLSLEETFWSQVWRCSHRWPCKKCCWPSRKVNLEKNTTSVWKAQPYFSDPRLKPLRGGRTHRMAYMFWHRTLLLPSIILCHQCDFGPCSNPAHMKPGTSSDNGKDKRGKIRSGRNHAPVFLPDGRVFLYSDARREAIIQTHMMDREFDRRFMKNLLGHRESPGYSARELAWKLECLERELVSLPPRPIE